MKKIALVNNAAILLPQSRVEQMAAARLNQIFSTNITGYFLCSREAVDKNCHIVAYTHDIHQ